MLARIDAVSRHDVIIDSDGVPAGDFESENALATMWTAASPTSSGRSTRLADGSYGNCETRGRRFRSSPARGPAVRHTVRAVPERGRQTQQDWLGPPGAFLNSDTRRVRGERRAARPSLFVQRLSDESDPIPSGSVRPSTSAFSSP